MKKDIKTKVAFAVFLLAAGVAASSCSIKEDRRECPCYLTVVLDRIPYKMTMKNAGLWENLVHPDAGLFYQETISPSDYPAPDWLIIPTPRGYVSHAAAIGRVHYRPDATGTVLTLPKGYEADSLYAHSARVDCREELARDTVELHKQWCTLTIKLKGTEVWKPYSFEVRGSWNSLSLYDLSAVEGEFAVAPRQLAIDRYEVRIPRQGDNSLMLVLYENNPDGTRGDKVVYDYPIGRLIYAAGYDWFTKDLDDATITVDYAVGVVEATINPWDNGQDFGDIEI